MDNGEKATHHPGTDRKFFPHWYWMPLTVLVLGILSTSMVIWIYQISEKQRVNFELGNALMNLYMRTATFHLWFEEAVTEGTRADIERTLADVEVALRLSDTISYGGQSERGAIIEPPDALWREHAEPIRRLLAKLKQIALQRSRDPKAGGIGSPLDEEFDNIFREFQAKAGDLEILAAKNQARQHTRTERLILGILLMWTLIVSASTAGLWNHQLRRRRAEVALKGAYEEMELRVEARTAELANTNSQLQAEIVERKRVEDSLRESEDEFRRLSIQFRTLLNAIPDSITLISPDLKVLWANKSAAGLSSGHVSDPTGQPCCTIWHGGSAPCDECPALKSFAAGKAASSRISSPDGRLWEVGTFPLIGEDGIPGHVMEIATDITERVTLQAEATRAAHLASIGELAAGVAHEINNPINGIINYAQILSNKSPQGSREHDLGRRIYKEGRRIADIVRALLSFARDQRDEKKPIHIHEVLSEALSLTGSQMLKEDMKVVVEVPPELPEILANQQQIQQVFMNVISNARYALNEKYHGAHKNNILEILGEQVSLDGVPHVRVTFSDRGTGIPAQTIGKVMDPFFTTKPSGKGTGLGLSISHGIILDHGGTLTVESVEGEFTKVIIHLRVREGNRA